MKKCSVCGVEKDINNFYSQKKGKDGLHSQCKECVKISVAAYYQKNIDRIKIQLAAYRQEHVAQTKRYHDVYRQENAERIKIWHAAHYQENVERIKIQHDAYYQKNIDKIKKQGVANYRKNPEPYARRAAERKRRLGWIPLNEPTEGYEAHHIGKDYVIFIPHDIHRSIYHNQKTGKGMSKINEIAFAYLLPGVR